MTITTDNIRTDTKSPYEGLFAVYTMGVLARTFEVLSGDFTVLSSIFVFNQTPQGHRYWMERNRGDVPLNEADIQFLRGYAHYVCDKIIERTGGPVTYVQDHEFFDYERYDDDYDYEDGGDV